MHWFVEPSYWSHLIPKDEVDFIIQPITDTQLQIIYLSVWLHFTCSADAQRQCFGNKSLHYGDSCYIIKSDKVSGDLAFVSETPKSVANYNFMQHKESNMWVMI